MNRRTLTGLASTADAPGGRQLRCAVVGASGYAGAELVGLLAVHPAVRLEAICAEGTAGRRFEALHPSKASFFRGEIAPFEPERLDGLDVVFLALPSGAAAHAAAALESRVGCVIDLSGDHRLPEAGAHERWYGEPHPAPHLLRRAVYGLPELFGDDLPGASLVACAGCYATVSQLACAPLLATGGGAPSSIASISSIAISAISGTTGAGRKAELALSFSEVTGNLRAYRVGRHQHTPEIAQGLTRLVGRPIRVTFVPHLAPLGRGIFATVLAENSAGWTPDTILERFRAFYESAPFVTVLDPRDRLPEVRDVAGTNDCLLAPVIDEAGGSIVVLGAIDNLLKGAAGQAVQVMNRVFGLEPTCGLVPGSPMEVCHA